MHELIYTRTTSAGKIERTSEAPRPSSAYENPDLTAAFYAAVIVVGSAFFALLLRIIFG
jgi:hypothetical protein